MHIQIERLDFPSSEYAASDCQSLACLTCIRTTAVGLGIWEAREGGRGRHLQLLGHRGGREGEDMEEEESLSHCCPSSGAPFWERPREKSQGEERIERKRPLSWRRAGERGREKGRRMMTFPGRGDEILLSFRKLFESQKWNRECYYFFVQNERSFTIAYCWMAEEWVSLPNT